MHTSLFNEFLAGADTLQVYEGNQLVFSSKKGRLLPLLEYIYQLAPYHRNVIILDKIMGNAAVLLSVTANCQEVYGSLGSQLAIKTLDKYGIKYHLAKIVPYIQKPNGEDMCPMEKLSIDKEPEEFYDMIRETLSITPEAESSGKKTQYYSKNRQ